MNIMNSSGAMLLGILVMSTIVLAGSAPLSSYERKSASDDRPKVYLLVDQRRSEENVMPGSSNSGFGIEPVRKKFGSLSVTHNLDTLRGRVLLQLARLNQQKVDENRRQLDDIGKRSNTDYVFGANRTARSDSKTGRNRSAASNRIPWMSEDEDPLYRDSQEDWLSKTRGPAFMEMQANELRLL